jgi:hypothetical protein
LFWFQRNSENNDVETSSEALMRFGNDYLISWNVLDPDGNPYPATGDGVCSVHDSGLVTSVMMGWIEAVIKPAPNLSERYNAGDTLEEDMTQKLGAISNSL